MSAEKEVIHPPIPKSKLKDQVWSYSRLSTFERCERSFFHKYIEDRPTPPNMPMTMGKILHRAIEWVVKQGYEPSDAARFAIYEAEGLPEGENYTTILHMLQNAIYRIPQNVDVQSEVHLVLNTTLGKVQAFVDLLIDDPSSDAVELWDYKSGWQDQEANLSKQIALYAWMLTELRGTSMGGQFIGRIIMPRINSETYVEITPEIIAEAKKWFIRTVHAITSKSEDMEVWAITKNKKNCETCPFVGMCASGIHELGFSSSGEVTSMEDAAIMGEYILMQEMFIKSLKKGLKSFVETTGPVPIGKNSWHIQSSTPSPKVEDMAELMSFAIENGLDITKAVKAEPNKVQEWLDVDDSGRLEQLIQWTSVRKTLKFGETQSP